MIKVKSCNDSQCKSILYKDNPSFSSIVIGNSKGELWINNRENPTVALAYSAPVGGFVIMGIPENDDVFLQFLEKEFLVELKAKGLNYFEFSVEEPILEKRVLEKFSNRKMNQEDEYFYRKYDETEVDELNNYTVLTVNSETINHLNSGVYDNPAFLNKKILESWNTYEEFLDSSLAFIAIKEKTIVGVIIGTAVFDKVVAIDIETHVDHRKKGIAKTLTQYFVNECIQRELIPQWNCVDSNIPSKNTAESLGFKLLKKKSFYWVKL
jgi:ribosomal protein S18 acetylase RimI-like enzyme